MKTINGEYWLATDNGLYVIDKSFSIRKHFTKKPSQGGLLSNTVRAISEYNNGQVWLGTNEGLNTVRLLDHKVFSHTKAAHHSALSGNRIMSLFKDSSTKVWVATFNGISVHNPISSLFKHQLYDFNKSTSVDTLTKNR